MLDKYNNFYRERSASRERKMDNKENSNGNIKMPPQQIKAVNLVEQISSSNKSNKSNS